VAVDIPSLEIEEGSLFGIIGADGAGKTTLFRLIATLFKPKQGNISIFGHDSIRDFANIRKFTGYMPSRFSLYEDLTIKENMNFFASVFETTVEENYSLIEDIYVMLKPFENRKAGNLSGGMKQKLALCSALIHKPKLLLLDEPTTGVDPASRQEFWEMLLKLQKRGITIIVSTPYLDEAVMCDKLALMHKSKIIASGKTIDFIDNFTNLLFHIKASDKRTLIHQLREFPSCHSAYSFGDSVHYQDTRKIETEQLISELRAYLEALGQSEIDISEQRPTIEDAFIEYLNREQNND
jgi:ABC-type multidrug transport system ATPase subunit